MNKRVYNKTGGKIFRTLGFLLILIVSLVLTASLIDMSNITFLASVEPLATQVLDLVPAVVLEYVGLGLLVGLLCLVWAIRRGLVLRLFITVSLLVIFLLDAYTSVSFFTGYMVIAPSWLTSVLDAIAGPLDQLIAISQWVAPGVALLAVMLLWGVFANARPKRFSIFFIRIATITLFFGVVAMALAENLTATFVTADWFMMVQYLCYIASFALIAFGSVFGVIGFYRK